MTDDEILENLEEATKNAMSHQLDAIQSILERNGGVRYLETFCNDDGAAAPLDLATFRHAVPFSYYEDYVDCINRMANGLSDEERDQPLLSVDPLICFFYSSGTSSMKPKLIPYFDSKLSKAASYIAHQGSGAVLRRYFPPRPSANKILWFIYADNITTTKGGYKVMAASAYPLHNNANWSQLSLSSSPKEVILGSNIEQQMYCHLLCGLRNADSIDGIRAPYANGLVNAFSLLESKWKQLSEDLENGLPCPEISDVSLRTSVVEVLGSPQLELSKRVRSICEENNWFGIVGRLWPNVRYIKCVATGSMEHYFPKLKHYAGEIPVLGGDYFASECVIGINLDITQPPEKTRFVLIPTAAYFEFLPFNLEKNKSICEESVDFSGVKIGQLYELVVTTFRGFYRYRLGDVVKVVGFYNSSPHVQFMMRAPKNPLEIITERDLMFALENFKNTVRNDLEIEIIEFASFLDLELNPKQMKVFIEVREMSNKFQDLVMVFRRCYSSLEDSLGGLYKVKRDRCEVGPLLLYIVKSDCFQKLAKVAIENGAPAGQYKPPKIIRNRVIVDMLEEGSSVVTI